MNKLLLAAAAASALVAGSANAAVVVTNNTAAFGTVPAGETVFANFDNLTPAYTQSGSVQIVTGSTNGYTAPNNTKYMAIGANGLATFDLGFSTRFSLDVSTLDTYNTFRIFTADGQSTLFGEGGIAVPPPADGRTNTRLTFTSNSNQLLTRVQLGSVNQNALEVDNLSRTAAVPEPATWGLMLMGFGLVGAGMRSRRRSAVVTYA